MKKADIHILVIEELTDLLYELNDVYNLQRDVNTMYGEQLHHRIMKTIFYTAFAIESVSRSTDTPRGMDEMVKSIIAYIEADGYVDRGDLEYAINKASTHAARINLAYSTELEQGSAVLLQIIELCLTDTNYLLYGTDTDIKVKPGNNVRFTQGSTLIQE